MFEFVLGIGWLFFRQGLATCLAGVLRHQANHLTSGVSLGLKYIRSQDHSESANQLDNLQKQRWVDGEGKSKYNSHSSEKRNFPKKTNIRIIPNTSY